MKSINKFLITTLLMSAAFIECGTATQLTPLSKTFNNGTGSSYNIQQGSNNTYAVESTKGSGRVWTNTMSTPVQLVYQLGTKQNPGKQGNSQLAAGSSITMADQLYTITISQVGRNAKNQAGK